MSEEILSVFKDVVEPMAVAVVGLEAKLHRVEHTVLLLLGIIHRASGGDGDMAKIHDEIKTALTDNESEMLSNEAKLTSLLALKGEGDEAFKDILEAVKAQVDKQTSIGKMLDTALDSEKTASDAVAEAPTAAVAAEAPVATASAVDVPGSAETHSPAVAPAESTGFPPLS